MSRWEEYDDEAKEDNRMDFGFVFSFKLMFEYLDKIDQSTKEWDDKYPKKLLINIWASAMVIMLIAFLCSYQIMLIISLPFIFLHLIVLIKEAKIWARFGYSKMQYFLMTVPLILVEMLLGGLSWTLWGKLF